MHILITSYLKEGTFERQVYYEGDEERNKLPESQHRQIRGRGTGNALYIHIYVHLQSCIGTFF